jgi:spore coat protein U-like protein
MTRKARHPPGRRSVLISFALYVACVLMAIPESAEAARLCRANNLRIDLGNYVPGIGVPLQVVGTLRLRCNGRPSSGQPDFVLIRIGGGATANPMDRRLGGAPDGVPFQVYKDAGYSQIWGDDTAGTTSLRVNLPRNRRRVSMTISVYARIEGTEDPLPGPYSDNLLVETNY